MGLQSLLLQCYNDASMTNVKSALDTIPAAKQPKIVEIAISPYLDTSCQIPAGKSRFANITALIDKLRSLGIQVRVTIHVGNLHDSVRNGSLGTRMKEVWVNVVAPYLNDAGTQFHISPSLEDQFTIKAFGDALDRLMTQLDYQQVKMLTDLRRFTFRRSPIVLDSKHVNTSTITYRVFRDTKDPAKPSFTIPIRYEFHGSSPRSGYEIWSNDGFLAYTNQDEHHTHHVDALLNGHEQFTLEQFQERAAAAAVALFWRPAYNVFDFEVISGERRYSKKNKRKDGRAGKFDAREVSALNKILSQ